MLKENTKLVHVKNKVHEQLMLRKIKKGHKSLSDTIRELLEKTR